MTAAPLEHSFRAGNALLLNLVALFWKKNKKRRRPRVSSVSGCWGWKKKIPLVCNYVRYSLSFATQPILNHTFFFPPFFFLKKNSHRDAQSKPLFSADVKGNTYRLIPTLWNHVPLAALFEIPLLLFYLNGFIVLTFWLLRDNSANESSNLLAGVRHQHFLFWCAELTFTTKVHLLDIQ